jgi:hypothetical protein
MKLELKSNDMKVVRSMYDTCMRFEGDLEITISGVVLNNPQWSEVAMQYRKQGSPIIELSYQAKFPAVDL